MVRKHNGIAALAVAAAVIVPLLASCSEKPEWIKTYFTLEGRTERLEDVAPSSVEELKETARKYRAVVEEKVDAANKEAYYLRLLGSAYLSKQMYGEALEAFEASARLLPANASLFYYIGLCSSQVGKSSTGPSSAGRMAEHFRSAEKSYLRALELDPTHDKSMYALAVLYAYELERPSDAVPLAERYLSINTEDDSGRFVLARSYYLLGRIDDAIAVYELIAQKSKNPRSREDAERNIDALRANGGRR